MIFLIDVLTWHDSQRALVTFFFYDSKFSIDIKVSITLQKVQVTLILLCVIVASEDFSKLIAFSGFPSHSFYNMFLATGEGFGT
jgi:hypothetical protein